MLGQQIVQVILLECKHHSSFPIQQLQQLLLIGAIQSEDVIFLLVLVRIFILILVDHANSRTMLPDGFINIRQVDASGVGNCLFQIQHRNVVAALHRNHALRIFQPMFILLQEVLFHGGLQLLDIGGHQYDDAR